MISAASAWFFWQMPADAGSEISGRKPIDISSRKGAEKRAAADAVKKALQMGADKGVHVLDDAIAGSDAPAGEDDAADSGSPDHDASSDDDVWGRESCSEAMPGSFWVWSWFGSCGERPLEAAETLIR